MRALVVIVALMIIVLGFVGAFVVMEALDLLKSVQR